MTPDRQEIIDHARTVLAIVDHDDSYYPPADVSEVARAFAEAVCDRHPGLANQLAGAVRDTARYDALALAEAIMRTLDIPEDSPAGETLTRAFMYWAVGDRHSDDWQRHGHAVAAAQLAGEAVYVWASEQSRPIHRLWTFTYDPNAPDIVLAEAKRYLSERVTA